MDFFSKYCQKGLQRIQSPFFSFTISQSSLYWVRLPAEIVFFKGCHLVDLTKICLLREVLNHKKVLYHTLVWIKSQIIILPGKKKNK